MTEWQPRVGVCCGVEAAQSALACGADYVELPAASLADIDPDLDPCELQAETTNLFLPGDFRLCGPGRTPAAVLWEYVDDTLARADRLGVKLMVVGSGGARRAPQGVGPGEALETFVEFVEQAQSKADGYGITLAPESLNRKETNVGNDLGALARCLGERGLAYTCDTRHVLVEWGFCADTGEVPSQKYLEEQIPFAPAHLHLATAEAKPPSESDRGVWAVVERVRSLGFSDRVSFECRWEHMERELPIAKKLALRALLGGAA